MNTIATCNECGRKFVNILSLQKHKDDVHPINRYPESEPVEILEEEVIVEYGDVHHVAEHVDVDAEVDNSQASSINLEDYEQEMDPEMQLQQDRQLMQSEPVRGHVRVGHKAFSNKLVQRIIKELKIGLRPNSVCQIVKLENERYVGMDDDQLSEDDVWRILKMNITQIINRPKTVDDSNRISLAASDTRQRFYTVLNDEQKGETKAVVSETPSAVAIVTSFMTRICRLSTTAKNAIVDLKIGNDEHSSVGLFLTNTVFGMMPIGIVVMAKSAGELVIGDWIHCFKLLAEIFDSDSESFGGIGYPEYFGFGPPSEAPLLEAAITTLWPRSQISRRLYTKQRSWRFFWDCTHIVELATDWRDMVKAVEDLEFHFAHNIDLHLAYRDSAALQKHRRDFLTSGEYAHKDDITELEDNQYLVKSSRDDSVFYIVNIATGLCECEDGQQKAHQWGLRMTGCQHAAAVLKHFDVSTFALPIVTKSQKDDLKYLRTGKRPQPSEHLAGVRPPPPSNPPVPAQQPIVKLQQPSTSQIKASPKKGNQPIPSTSQPHCVQSSTHFTDILRNNKPPLRTGRTVTSLGAPSAKRNQPFVHDSNPGKRLKSVRLTFQPVAQTSGDRTNQVLTSNRRRRPVSPEIIDSNI